MSRRSYFSIEEEEDYREGQRDGQHHRHNYERNRYSEEDKAYFQGVDDEAREEKRKEEERMIEEEQERQEMRRQERIEYQRYLEEAEFYDQMLSDEKINNEISKLSEMPEDLDLLFSQDDDE